MALSDLIRQRAFLEAGGRPEGTPDKLGKVNNIFSTIAKAAVDKIAFDKEREQSDLRRQELEKGKTFNMRVGSLTDVPTRTDQESIFEKARQKRQLLQTAGASVDESEPVMSRVDPSTLPPKPIDRRAQFQGRTGVSPDTPLGVVAQVPELRKQVFGQPEVDKDLLGGLTKQQQTLAQQLSDDYRAVSTDFQKQSNAFNRIVASAQDPSAAGDLALIFNYMKLLDPGSVVRESEFANAQNSAGVPEIIRAKYNSILRGERLAPETRADFVDRSQRLYEGAKRQQQLLTTQFTNRAKFYGIPSNLVVTDFGSVSSLPDPNQPNLIKVIEKSSGRSGSIPANEFDPNLYTKVGQ